MNTGACASTLSSSLAYCSGLSLSSSPSASVVNTKPTLHGLSGRRSRSSFCSSFSIQFALPRSASPLRTPPPPRACDSRSPSSKSDSLNSDESQSRDPLLPISQLSRRLFLLNLLTLPALSSVFAETLTTIPVDAPSTTSPPSPSPPPPPPPPPATVTKPKWSYTAPTGPASWGDLSADYATASTGLNQSPISLSYKSALPPSDATKRPTMATTPSTFTFKLKDNPAAQNPALILDPYFPPPPPVIGDAPPIDLPSPPPPPAFINYDSASYAFKSMHLHTGASEHVVDNAVGAAEFHFVFERRPRLSPPPPAPPPPAASTTPSSPPSSSGSAEGLSSSLSDSSSNSSQSASAQPPSLIVPSANAEQGENKEKSQMLIVALLAKKADESAEWVGGLLKRFVEKAGADGRGPGILIDMDVKTMLVDFDSSDLYVYPGSLTTPPCTEGVTWAVLQKRCSINREDLKTITRLQNGANVRPLQPANDRKVIRYPRLPLS